MKKGDILELTIADTAEDDACIARLPDGMVVLVRGLVTPGDQVEAVVIKLKNRMVEARFTRLLVPSPDRVEPVCSHYGVCGGCKWQHVQYARQLAFKRKVVRDALERIGGFAGVDVAEPLACHEPYGYRNKVDFTFSNQRFILDDEMALSEEQRSKPSDFALGFHRRGYFNKIIDIDYCHLASPATNQVLALTRRFFLENRFPAYCTMKHEGFLRNLMIRHAGTTGELMVNLITSWHEPTLMAAYRDLLLAEITPAPATIVNSVTERKNLVAYAEQQHVLHGPGFIREVLDGLVFQISPNSFFQTNSAQALALYRTVADMAAVGPHDMLYDLYCGTGSITLFAGRTARAACGFELEASAVEDARGNASRNGIAHATFFATDMKALAGVMNQAGPRPDCVVTDPPRAGMHEKALEALKALAPPRIVYVSCHPGSLARDLRLLCEGGTYTLKKVQPVDLFPQTFHIETVARLTRHRPA